MTLLKIYNRNGQCVNNEYRKKEFSELMNEFPFTGYFSPDSRYGTPRVNIKEEHDLYKIEMEAPGISKEFLNLNLEKDLITISYKDDNASARENFTYMEFNYTNFERSFTLPDSVDKEKISAAYSEGILIVNLPKKEEAVDKGPRTIEIS